MPLAPTSFHGIWPRERGAVAQIGIALGAGLLIGPVTSRSLAQAGATLAIFLMVEPLRVWRNGKRSPAMLILGTAALALLAATWMERPGQAVALLVPGFPAGIVLALLVAGKEHSVAGEQFSACAFGCSAFPVLVAAGRALTTAVIASGFLAITFCTASLSVQALRRSARSTVPWAWRSIAPLLGFGFVALSHDAYKSGFLLVSLEQAFLPVTLAMAWIAIRPPTELKTVGWILAAGSFASTIWCVAVLR